MSCLEQAYPGGDQNPLPVSWGSPLHGCLPTLHQPPYHPYYVCRAVGGIELLSASGRTTQFIHLYILYLSLIWGICLPVVHSRHHQTTPPLLRLPSSLLRDGVSTSHSCVAFSLSISSHKHRFRMAIGPRNVFRQYPGLPSGPGAFQLGVFPDAATHPASLSAFPPCLVLAFIFVSSFLFPFEECGVSRTTPSSSFLPSWLPLVYPPPTHSSVSLLALVS